MFTRGSHYWLVVYPPILTFSPVYGTAHQTLTSCSLENSLEYWIFTLNSHSQTTLKLHISVHRFNMNESIYSVAHWINIDVRWNILLVSSLSSKPLDVGLNYHNWWGFGVALLTLFSRVGTTYYESAIFLFYVVPSLSC